MAYYDPRNPYQEGFRRQARPAQPVRPVPSPPQEPYRAQPRRGQEQLDAADAYARQMGWQQVAPPRPAWQRSLGRILRAIGILSRVCAILLAILVVADAFLTGTAGSAREALMGVTQAAQGLLPKALAGVLVIATPFGGALRGDFIIASISLFVIDWLLQKAARALGQGEAGML